ncbi:MAG: hypothetical protein WCI22_03435 [Actinomycetota bacterium]
MREPFAIRTGAVLDHASPRLLDDIALASEVGLTQVRLDVPWQAAQPRAGTFDGDVFERVHAAAATARGLGVATWFRLLQPAVPLWFDNEGGFADERNAGAWWPRWVELVADRLGDVAAGWVPFEAPYAMALRLEPDDARKHGDLMHHLVVAWRDAWRILRGALPVATSLDVAPEPASNDDPHEIAEARRRDQLRWGLWLGGLRDGVVRIPGRAEMELADLDGACDVVGLAMRTDIEAGLYRVTDQGPERPLALTFRPMGDTDGQRAQHVQAMWQQVRSAQGDVRLESVTITPFADRDGSPGIVTSNRELKDAGHAFVLG